MTSKTADIIIIGGGPAGTSALWALERSEPGIRAILLEKQPQLGSGSSMASLEAFRTAWPIRSIAKQMERSLHVFHNADDYLGEGASQSIALKQQGYLFCAFNEKQADALQSDVQVLHQHGLTHIEHLEADDIRHRFPWLDHAVIAAKFDPQAGWLDSNALIHRYAQSTKTSEIQLGIQQSRIVIQKDKVVGVETEHGLISSTRVLIACGSAARMVGRTAGIELPVVMIPRQSFTTGWRHDAIPAHSPMIIGTAPHPHMRPEAGSGAIFGYEYAWNTKHVPDHKNGSGYFLTNPVESISQLRDQRFPSIVLHLLAKQFGHKAGEGFASPRYLTNIHHNIGYYVYRDHTTAHTEDRKHYLSERAIIDKHPEINGLFVSIAHVGHGIMTSPASGEIAASHILGNPLPDPIYTDFSFDVTWVEHDEAVL